MSSLMLNVVDTDVVLGCVVLSHVIIDAERCLHVVVVVASILHNNSPVLMSNSYRSQQSGNGKSPSVFAFLKCL